MPQFVHSLHAVKARIPPLRVASWATGYVFTCKTLLQGNFLMPPPHARRQRLESTSLSFTLWTGSPTAIVFYVVLTHHFIFVNEDCRGLILVLSRRTWRLSMHSQFCFGQQYGEAFLFVDRPSVAQLL